MLPGKIKFCDGQEAEQEATATGGTMSESLGDSTGKVLEAGCETIRCSLRCRCCSSLPDPTSNVPAASHTTCWSVSASSKCCHVWHAAGPKDINKCQHAHNFGNVNNVFENLSTT